MKGPFKGKIAQRHYVFHDWRYQFTFRDVKDVKSTVGTVLGSMSPETSCVCHFSWHFPGSEQYKMLSSPEDMLLRQQDLERGIAAVQAKNAEEKERSKAYYSHSLHWNAGLKRGPV
eukprot:CAMPEP_0206542478 /NCGR_PEP_ID=MMETSP0325_2-20121206/10185_1 /ASSEMBLY_ACC=CAM_ASM_000347 /TAXON_ID=2866 /ORGANISM="Crypthecodinium cohnii, Strain Seligo" /LENGTH=115 /DNA_ID=CAMNT_0054040521 /DNA_START=551 /DNA_END=898 /DNA_ORIENTATION=-